MKADVVSKPLTELQQRMLELLAEGRSIEEIAKATGYQPGTMRVYLHTLYRHLGVGNRSEAAAWFHLRNQATTAAWTPIEQELPRTADRERWFAVKLSADGAARLARLGCSLPVRALKGAVVRDLRETAGITHWLGPLPE